MDALNALSVDLEEYFQVSNFDGVIPRDSWDGLASRVGDSTRRLLDLFDRTGSRSTFFVLGWVAERHPGLVRTIADRGHEIACHGYGHELVYEIGPERFREDLGRARAAIEDAVGQPVRGYRAPSYSITHRSLWALETLAELGFEYDSSIFPIRHHRYGIPEFERLPVRLRLRSGAQITEFPLSTLRMLGGNFPIAGGAYLRFLPSLLFRMGFSRLVRAGRPTVLYLHPWEIDPGQPLQDVGRKTRINHYYNLDRMESKLAGLLERHPFTTLADVLGELEARGRLAERALDDLVVASDVDADPATEPGRSAA
jgi:polysaccharide deacetylase family protein (PEP-CTERM system associated)